MTTTDPRDQAILDFANDRPLAHEVLFAGPRHKNKRPDFHIEIINDFHSSEPQLCDIVFRGGGKSSIAEEAICVMAALREFNHGFIVGPSAPKAEERLHAIRRQFEKNEMLAHVFGDLRGQPWSDEKIELTNGVTIQAMGRGQAIRGTKNEDFRPDLILIDDIEDKQSISTPDGREKIRSWVLSELLPAGDIENLRVRIIANDMHPECLANELAKPGSGFIVKRFPIEYPDPVTGAPTSAWPDRIPLERPAGDKRPSINSIRSQLFSQGKADIWWSEYMCRSIAPEDKPFRRDMFRHAGAADCPPVVRTWQPVYAMIDPARSVRSTAATTGFAAWSRIANRLVVWESWAKRLMPDEQIAALFEFNEAYHPVKIGFEEDGLNEWALQPIRAEQARRGVVLPLVPVKAPKSKFDFIRALQFGFNARETIFAKALPDLETQLVGFPSGYIDAPNALAYSHHPKLSTGVPMYEDFAMEHVAEDLVPVAGKPMWLCLNATGGLVTGVLVQMVDGALRIHADWVREGEPGAVALDIVKEANLDVPRGGARLVAGPQHFERYGNVGLVQAVRRLPAEVRRAALPETGRNECRALLKKLSRGLPAFLVSSRARWTLNGLAGGYARAWKATQLMEYPEEGTYRILCEGLESFLGMMQSVGDEAGDTRVNATAGDGRRFFSALAHRRTSEE